MERSLKWADRLLAEAKLTERSDLLLAGHWAAAVTTMWCGGFSRSAEHCATIEANYDSNRDGRFLGLLGYDPKTVAGVHNACNQFALGFPDRAVGILGDAIAHARRIGHPNDLAYALSIGSRLHGFRREPAGLAAALAEVESLGRDHSLPFYDQVWVPMARIWVKVLSGKRGGSTRSSSAPCQSGWRWAFA